MTKQIPTYIWTLLQVLAAALKETVGPMVIPGVLLTLLWHKEWKEQGCSSNTEKIWLHLKKISNIPHTNMCI